MISAIPTEDREWMVSYSALQGAFHVETIDEMIQANQRGLVDRRRTDFMPLFRAKDQDEAANFILRWEAKHGTPGPEGNAE